MKKIDKTILYGVLIISLGIYFVHFLNLNINFAQSNKVVGNLIDSKTEEIPKEISLLGRAEISFLGSTESRIENINLAISKINNKVVANGEEFSFNKTLGEVSSSLGYKEAKSFLNGEVVLGIGGGICHVSSVLFESLLDAGLPISERYNHTFSVPFYKTGLDATVSSLGPDLKFINDTGYDIRISGKVVEDKAIFEIYGVSDGRIASISEPVIVNKTNAPLTQYIETNDISLDGVCKNTPQIGYTAKVNYKVIYPNNDTVEKIFNSVYKPLKKSCYIYTDPITGCNSQTIYSPKTGIKCDLIP